MQLHKIKQYDILDLSRILFFRLLYSAQLTLRKIFVLLAKPRYQKLVTQKTNETYHKLTSSLFTYYGFISLDDEIIKEAATLALGQTRVFGQLFPFNADKDWLKDPISGIEWSKSLYWSNASFIVNGLSDVKFVLEINKLNDLVVFAKAYYYSKDERYIRLIEKYLNSWISCVPIEKSVANKIAMDFGFRIINLIHISLLCFDNDYFKDVIHPKITGIIKHHVSHLWKNLSSRWFKSGNDNNHNIGEIVGLYIGQIWLKEFGIKSPYCSNYYVKKELGYLKDLTIKLVSNNGCYKEYSANYTKVVYDFYLMFELFRHALDFKRNFGWFDNSGYFDQLSHYIKDISYHGQLPNFGDNDFAKVVIPFENTHNPVQYIETYNNQNNINPSNKYIEDGQCLYKSSDINEVYLFCRGGEFAHFVEGAYVHAHNDLLAIILSCKGEPIFIDKGTLFYNSGIEIRKEFTSTKAHNTIQIEDIEMADYLPIGYKNYPSSKLFEQVSKGNYFRFSGEVSYKNIKHSRNILYDGKVIQISDNINKTTTDTQKGYLRYLLAENITPHISNNSILLHNKKGEHICTIEIEGIESINIIKTDYAPHYALRKETFLLEGTFTIENIKKITTSIIL